MSNLTRQCPQCGIILTYSNKSNYIAAKKLNGICRKCSNTNRNYSGSNNPFYGKKHTEEAKKKISKFASEERVYSDSFIKLAKENLAKITNHRPVYDIWLEKYGKETADEKLQILKNKKSINNSGSKNPMYGKPSPEGSGNGWSGWYNQWFFRSLRELSYMINVIETEQLKWKSPQNIKIQYIDYSGNIRNYFPDFIIDNRMIEIKPAKLHNTPKVLAKKKAAEEFCINNNMIYELIDPPILSANQIKTMYLLGKINFLKKYEEKFKKLYL